MTETPSIYIPPRLSKVHPGLEPSLKSIAIAIAKLHGSVTAATKVASSSSASSDSGAISDLQTQITNLEAEISDLGVPLVETFGTIGALSYPCAVYEVISGNCAAADNASLATINPLLGIATGTATGGRSKVTTFGDVTFPGWTWTPDAPVFVGTAGALTQTVPSSDVLVVIGYATSPTMIRLSIAEPIVFGSTSAQLVTVDPDGSLGIGAASSTNDWTARALAYYMSA